jgi:AcrR family transcriptional regulator
MHLFRQHGYEATSIAAILNHAGVRSGSLYYFFPGKLDLLLAVLDEYTRLLNPMVVQPALDRFKDPVDRVFGILGGYRKMLLETEFRSGCPIASMALEMADKSDEVRRLVAHNFHLWKSAVASLIEDAADDLPDSTEPARLASFVLTVMEGAVMQAQVHQSIEPFDAAIDQLREFFDHRINRGKQARKG